MASKDERKLARTIIDLDRRLNASRAKQLPFTSVALDDGTEQSVADGVAAGRNAYDITVSHDGALTDIGDISDASAVESTFLPERLAISDGGTDAGFDAALIAWEKAREVGATVDEAHAAAARAVADALKAQQTADGKNTIYRQPINPVAPLDKPFANGDVWYRTIEVSGVAQIADVNMWNGTEWKLYQQVASSVLVPGSIGNVLIQDGAIDAKKMTVDALYGKVLRGNEIYGALIDGSKFRLSGLTNASTIVNDSGSSLTSWSGLNGTTLALDTGVFETGTRSIRGTRILGNDFGVSRQFPLVLSALTAWFRVRVASETIFTASIIRFNNVLGVYEPGAVSTPLVVPANTWTWVSVSGNALSGGMSWRSATLSAAAPQPTNVWIDRFQLVAGVEDQRSVEIARSSNGVPAIYGFGSTRQQRFTLDTGALDAAAGAAYGSLTLGTDDQERTAQYTPFGMRWGNKSGGALHGFVHQDDSYDGDLTLSAQGKSVRLLSKLDATVGVKAARWSAPWNDNKTAGFWYGSAVYAGDPPGSGWVLMTITKHEDQGIVIQEARRTLTPTLRVSRVWDGSVWSAWRGDTAEGDTDWIRLDGWTGDFAHSSAPVFYRRRMGYVEFKGGLTNSSWSGPLTSFGASMPPGFRPLQTGNFALPVNSTVSRTAGFNTDGSIRLYGSGSSGAWWVFDMVRYPIE